jgi:cytochrome c-type biogenesis protein CcmH/NrfG
VLTNLDSANVKALNRRAIANKSLGNVEEAIRDFQALLKTNPTNVAEIKKDIDELMTKLVQMNKAKKEAEAAKAPKPTSNSKILEMPETSAPKNPEQQVK